ncbi:MAG TPA: hypothetical protein VKT80_01600 [Chloroflexota bacterium]|nr:hypothetical protein [Chloroflexota bacterium]
MSRSSESAPAAARSDHNRSFPSFGQFLAIALVVAIIAVRFQIREILVPLRSFNRRFANKFVLSFAGEPGTPYAVIRHLGRRSGERYETPVVAAPTADGFIIALPYGTDLDWLRNLQASGQGKIFYGGAETSIAAPELIDEISAFLLLPERWRLICKLFGIKHYARLRTRSVVETDTSSRVS